MKKLNLKEYVNILIIKEGLEQLKGIRNQVSTDLKTNFAKEVFYRIQIACSNLSEIDLDNMDDMDEINKLFGIDIKHRPKTTLAKNIKIKEEKNNLKMNSEKDIIYISDNEGENDSFKDLTTKKNENNQEIIDIEDNISYINENSYDCNINILYEESDESMISQVDNDEVNEDDVDIEFKELACFQNIEKYHTRSGRSTNKVSYSV